MTAMAVTPAPSTVNGNSLPSSLIQIEQHTTEPALPTTKGHVLPKCTTTTITTSTPSRVTTVIKTETTSVTTTATDLEHNLLTVAAKLDEKLTAFLQAPAKSELLRNVQQQVKISLEVVEEALRKFRFEELAMSFNGGKDCLVLLIIYLCGISRHYAKHQQQGRKGANFDPRVINSVYVMSKHPFAEVDEFVDECIAAYHLSLHRYPVPMKVAFQTYLYENPDVKAIFVGTRRTDPHGEHLEFFQRTDHNWPDFIRVHPVIDWHYQEIWAFLRELDIPYCCLYDLGYTSLGGTTDTLPNPALATGETNLDGTKRYKPAYELLADEEERLGREKK